MQLLNPNTEVFLHFLHLKMSIIVFKVQGIDAQEQKLQIILKSSLVLRMYNDWLKHQNATSIHLRCLYNAMFLFTYTYCSLLTHNHTVTVELVN